MPTGRLDSIAVVSTVSQVAELSAQELDALKQGAAWYAKYHERMIAEQADDRSAAAVSRREHFQDLHEALRKLGVRIRKPDGLPA
jgi:hypothetical protein